MAQLGNCCNESDTVHDAVCSRILLPNTNGTLLPVWENDTGFVINGTIVVKNEGSSTAPTAQIFVNGMSIPGLNVPPGQTRSVTLDNLKLIQIDGIGGALTSEIQIDFSLNYQF